MHTCTHTPSLSLFLLCLLYLSYLAQSLHRRRRLLLLLLLHLLLLLFLLRFLLLLRLHLLVLPRCGVKKNLV